MKNLFNYLHSKLAWLFRLTAVFFRDVPLATNTIILTSLIAQLSLMLAMLLPLKVIMLLGSESGNGKFTLPQLAAFDRNEQVLMLCLLAIGFYVMQAIASKISQRAGDIGARKLLALKEKLVLFENQEKIAADAYRKYAGALSSLIFVLLASTVAAFIYPDAVIAMLAFAAVLLLTIILAMLYLPSTRENLRDNIKLATGTVSELLFFLVFAYVVVDFIYMQPPSFLAALVGMILIRQLSARAAVAVRDLIALNQNRNKINALFFHNQVFETEVPPTKSSIWHLLQQDRQMHWLDSVIQEVAGPQTNFTWEWLQSGLREILFLRVTLGDGRQLLVKVFGQGQRSAAQHEATLLLDPPENLPAPPLLLTTMVNTLHCHVLDISGLKSPTEQPTKSAVIASLFPIEPPAKLSEQYINSKTMLWDQLSQGKLQRLQPIANNDNKLDGAYLKTILPQIRHRLQALPLVITVRTDKYKMMLNSDDNIQILHWGKWRLEPLGAGWPMAQEAYSCLLRHLDTARAKRSSLIINVDDIELAALLSTMLKAFQEEDYLTGIGLWNRIDKHITSLQKYGG